MHSCCDIIRPLLESGRLLTGSQGSKKHVELVDVAKRSGKETICLVASMSLSTVIRSYCIMQSLS